MQQWGNFWVFPAIMAGVVMVLFAVTFWDTVKSEDEDALDKPDA